MKKSQLTAVIALLTGSFLAAPSFAQGSVVTTTAGQIVKIQSDWGINALLVKLDTNVSYLNPAGCALNDMYETSPDDQGAALNHSILLSAYLAHTPVALSIQGCSTGGRPHIIGVQSPN